MATEPIDALQVNRANDPGAILVESRRLKRLARGLLFDRGRAEDVVQEAWLAALRRAPASSWSLSAWLAGAVRRLAMNENRANARARRREAAAAREERLPATLDSVARIETLRSLVDAVEELEEPYRETILLRFFDELAPREVARRQGVPVETVRTRTRRGLQLLRIRLDARHGDARGTFLAALFPLAGKMPWPIALGLPAGSSPLVPWTGALVMSKSITLAVAAVAALLLAVVGFRALVQRAERPTAPIEAATVERATTAPEEPPKPRVAGDESGMEDARSVVALGAADAADADWIVRGHVSLGIGAPYPHARVRAELHEGHAEDDGPAGTPLLEELLVADENGDFAWALPAPETDVTVLARVDMPEHFGSSDWHAVLRGDPPPQTLQPHAYPIDSELVGRILDPDGNAVAGARIGTYLTEGVSGADGCFRLPASSYQRTIRGQVLAAGFAEERFSAKTSAPGTIDAGDLRLDRELPVTGRVVDGSGRPVEGATVAYSWSDDRTSATTDAGGHFELGYLDPDRDWIRIHATKEGYVLAQATVKENGKEPATEVELVLQRGGTVRGRVSLADGSPAEAIWLCIGFHPNGVPRIDTRSAADGTFEFPRAPVGAQTLWAVREGKETVRMPIEVPDGGVLDGVELVLRDGHHLAGKVLDEHDEPMPWVMVYVDADRRRGPDETYVASTTATDRQGRFRVEGLPEEALVLGFLEDGYSRLEVPVTEFDRDDLVIRMSRAGRLAGRVVDGRTGEPVDAFRIRFLPCAVEPGEEALSGYGATWMREGMTFSGTNGRWNADGEELEAGEWTGIEATAEGYGPTVAPRVQTVTDPDPQGLVLRLFPAASVRGQVVDAATGAPIAGATVKRFTDASPLNEQSWESTHPYWVETDQNGRFELAGVPAGEMALAVELEGGGLALDEPFAVPEGGDVERRIQVDEGQALVAHLLAPDGAPIAGAEIELQALETAGERRSRTATTEEDGSLRFEHLLPGLYHARWVERRGELRCYRITELVEIEPDAAETAVSLQLRGDATVFGTLHYAGTLPGTLSVTLQPRNAEARLSSAVSGRGWAPRAFAVVAENGSFVAEHLEPGTYTVMVFFQERDTLAQVHGSARVEVPAQGSVEVALEMKKVER